MVNEVLTAPARLELLDPPIPIVLQFRAQPMGDPPHLPLTDGDLGLIGEGFRSAVEGTAADGGADDLTKNRRRKIVRVEPQTGAERGKNLGDRPSNDRRVRCM